MHHGKLDATDHNRSLVQDRSAPSAGGDARSAFDGDSDRYLDHLAQLDMPLEMKIELIRALRRIMQSFVDRAFGDDPVQLTLSPNGGDDKDDESVVRGMLRSNHE